MRCGGKSGELRRLDPVVACKLGEHESHNFDILHFAPQEIVGCGGVWLNWCGGQVWQKRDLTANAPVVFL